MKWQSLPISSGNDHVGAARCWEMQCSGETLARVGRNSPNRFVVICDALAYLDTNPRKKLARSVETTLNSPPISSVTPSPTPVFPDINIKKHSPICHVNSLHSVTII